MGLLIKHCGAARFAWNWGVTQRRNLFKTRSNKERYTSFLTQNKEFNAFKKDKLSWMYEVSKCTHQEALKDLDHAYQKFYKKYKTGVGLPRFKKKGKHDSFRVNHRVYVRGEYVQLPCIGRIRTKESTSKFSGKLLSATVSREADRWYCSICVEVDMVSSLSGKQGIVGIDLGISDFAVISDGEIHKHIKAPKPLMKKLVIVKRVHRLQKRKIYNSNNYIKANLRLTRLYRKIRNIRKDFLHKLTTELTKTKSVIVIEDLNVAGLVMNRHIARSVIDVGWGDFKEILGYKSKWYGSQLIKIPRFEPSSKMCSKCGSVNSKLKLSDRVWICENCGVTHDRDENASDNIRNYGIKLLNTESSSEINACGESVSPSLNKAVLIEAGNKCKHCV